MSAILVLQNPAYVNAQRDEIEAALAELDVPVHVAGSVEEAEKYVGATMLITPTLPWLPDVLDRVPSIEWIHFLSAGVDRIWEMDFDKRHYRMSKSTGVHASTISEFALGAILYVLKGFGTFALQQRDRKWNRFWLDESEGKTLGIVGIGTIGRRLAQQASSLGMRVIGTVNTPRSIEHVDEVFGAADLDQVLSNSDFVVLLAPLTDRTRRLIGEEQLKLMRPNAWLINVARGELVDEVALIDTLQAGSIGGAILDVFEEEPLAASSPLWEMENVLITPHVAGTTQHYMRRALAIFRENYASFTASGELITPVSVDLGY